ncbi:hypothetical protein CH296_27310 [Rhodococcus sp. 14-2496-1d]|uniref:hypothetical protein n=1 Tax=Rhodococcus sp. 14-2496-1d TaxID=2023146 RepID=UPI000B9C42DD|nr:hypothetical protein [Rhodococcus sp. 14-2496-1d]OZF25542.1 hypothetical protein CH296_27310 [Rhodococcus sp. 14-2496-1d]
MVVTVPEKTLEHWISQYIANRYARHAALWWPTQGEDINVGSLPARSGKAIQLEVKTSTVTTTGHEVLINLEQLEKYLRKRFALQPFYVFPLPFWQGTLREDAHRRGDEVTEGGFKRSGSPRWFGHWMVVLTTQQVYAAINPRLGDPEKKVLARVQPGPYGVPHVTWPNAGGITPAPVDFPDFWDVLGRCGRPDWPQLVRLPTHLVGEWFYNHNEMLDLLQLAAANDNNASAESLTTFESMDREGFARASELDDFQEGEDSDTSGGSDEHRQIVFIYARNFR